MFRKNTNTIHDNKKTRKKFGLFYKISFFLILLISLILMYFVILVSSKPKSFPYITRKIENYIEQKTHQDVELKNSLISFTAYGSLKISIDNLKIKNNILKNENNEFILPKVETEFSLLDFLCLNFGPRKVKIINPDIIIDSAILDNSEQKPNDINPIINFLAEIQNGKIQIRLFEIENARLVFKKKDGSAREILLKKSQISIKSKPRSFERVLNISSNNIISLSEKTKDITLNTSCNLTNKHSTNCNLNLSNFDLSLIADLNPNLNILHNIKSIVSANSTVILNDRKLQNLSFNIQSSKGEANLPQYFAHKISFYNMAIKGEYNPALDTLNLSEITTDLAENPINSDKTPRLTMSLSFFDLQNIQQNKSDYYIKLENIANEKVERYWPIFLPRQDIRKWVLDHIYGGTIDSAYAKFNLETIGGETNLKTIDSKITFNNFNIKYDQYFPAITAINGIASFGKDNMDIQISKGDVLNSKISQARVYIGSFSDPISILNISGKLIGNAADALKHANYNSSFALEVDKYLNGNSYNDFDIRVPLKDQISLKDVYIASKSTVSNINNQFMNGSVTINTKKDFASNNFLIFSDLTAASLIANAFDITKNIGIESAIEANFIVKNDNNFSIKNLNLWKKDINPQNKNGKITNISADIEIQSNPFIISSATIKNNNFGSQNSNSQNGKNSYVITYQNFEKNKQNYEKIVLKGQFINLEPLFKNKIPQFNTNNNSIKNVDIFVSRVFLANQKSLNNFALTFTQNNQIYLTGFVRASYNKQNSFNLMIYKKQSNALPIITGNIENIGYLAEGMSLSDTISQGNAKVNIEQIINPDSKKPYFKGVLEINNPITFYENKTTKRLESNSLFSQVKDKIFSNNKTIFTWLKINFNYSKQQNLFEIESLIANNYKIGITAKGIVNLTNNSYNIKGMIIPGFVINNLFGIGNIPLIGGVISNLLTGGEGGGVFGIKYEYIRLPSHSEAVFKTYPVSSFVPSTIRNLFDLL